MPGLFEMFADYAKKYGVERAVNHLKGDFPSEKIEALQLQYNDALAKVHSGGPPVIAAGNHEPWYSGAGEDSIFWSPLKAQFASDGWPQERIDSVDTATDHVVAHTPRPTRPSYRAKGLVVGYVQSGKTTNFTSVIAKLADEDYRMVIVLSGIHNGLRRQTQVRLDSQLKELNTERWWTLTTETSDFPNQTVNASVALSSDKCVLAVVKKNPAVLRRLLNWLDDPNARQALKAAPVLVIDDEADQASVATKTINPLIQKILDLMPKHTYVGYTATPFANVFIDPSETNDLYPRDFILNLPEPEGYFGPEKIFGRDTLESDSDDDPVDGYDMVRIVPDDTIGELLPLDKAASVGFVPTITDELGDALRWFWLATAAKYARNLRGHSTMLIHTSIRIDIHEAYREPLESFRHAALQELANSDSEMSEWRRLWESESARVPAAVFGRAAVEWGDVRANLAEVIGKTRVILDNYRSAERLKYDEEKEIVAIAVGGNTLSRGLTLEGLVVSFFVRSASAYDTLLQMGRWFGYRTGYEDLPRIWMTLALEEAFRHLATVEHEMRADIDFYQKQNATPTQVAVRIRTHPLLRVTAKMGAAIPAYVSYAGRRLQTRYFRHRDAAWLDRNLQATRRLLSRLPSAGEQKGAARLYRDVDVADVLQFLEEYQVHEDSTELSTDLIRKYIEKQTAADDPALTKWSVAVIHGEPGDGELIDVGFGPVPGVIRARLNDSHDERADIKTLMSKEHRVIDLPISQSDARKEGESDLAEMRNTDTAAGANGLLVIYPIDKVSSPQAKNSRTRVPLDAVEPVIGIGIVFPGDAGDKNKIFATHVAVDLRNIEEMEDLDEILESDPEEGQA